MLQSVRLPYVRFETSVAESKDAKGHPIYQNVYHAYVTPAGGKDEVVKVAEEWIAELKKKGDTRGPFDAAANEYRVWHEQFSKAFDAFRNGEEMQIAGTPLRACMAFLKSEIMQAERAHIFSIEDLAACNEEALANMGLGARNLKVKAQEILNTKSGTGQAEEIAALRQKVEDLQDLIEAMRAAGIQAAKPEGNAAVAAATKSAGKSAAKKKAA